MGLVIADTKGLAHDRKKRNRTTLAPKGIFLLGLTAALSLAVPVTLSALSDAEAQTAGMERREDRREGRHERGETAMVLVNRNQNSRNPIKPAFLNQI